MLLFDANVVLAAYRADHAHHQTARAALTSAVHEPGGFTVPLGVWLTVLRLATDRRVFPVPSSPTEVLDFADAVAAQPGYLPYAPDPGHLTWVRGVCTTSSAAGKLVPDASLAAQALELGAEVVTFDRDFHRFAGVRSRILAAP